VAVLPMTVAAAKPMDYEVTVINLTPGQPLGPHLIAVQTGKKAVPFKAGKAASAQLAAAAETGFIGDLYVALDENDKKYDTQGGVLVPAIAGGVAGAATYPSSVSETFGPYDKNAPFLISVISGMPCTNDGFAAALNIKLPKKIGQFSVAEMRAYDAGSETNTELTADISPNCEFWMQGAEGEPPIETPDQPELAEGGKIAKHPGIAGAGDLDADVYGWDGPVGLVMVKAVAPPEG
jgi:hypothetical protein